MPWLTLLAVLNGKDIIVDKGGIKEDLLAWRLNDIKMLAEEYDKAFTTLLELLNDDNPHVRANVIQVLMDMLSEGKLEGERLKLALDSVLELVKDEDERVALKALEFINALLETGELTEEEYKRVTEALKEVVKSGMPILGEYAAEGLGKLGAKVARIAYKIIQWLFSLIGSSKKREVQSAAITALTEMAMKTSDSRVLNEVFDGISDLLAHPDPYVVERALYSIDRMLSREKDISMRNKLKAITRIKELRSDIKLGTKASQVLEKLEKATVTSEEVISEAEAKKRLEISQYSIDDVDRLLDAGKTEIVAEMAKLDSNVMDMVLDMLESDDYSRRMDALWIVARLTSHLTPSDAYRILPVLGDFLKSKNPWARETAAKVLADIYALYPGTSRFFTTLLDTLLKSGNPRDVEGALELMAKLLDRLPSKDMFTGMLKLVLRLLDDEKTRGVTLRVLAREAQKLLDLDTEDLFALEHKLKEIYGKEGGKYDNIIAGLIDVIEDILKMRRQGIVMTSD
ncbi:hypothetical protein TEU_01700 [Thermococcus eurythermalis]|uniref:Condensin complex subunit 1 C-terminal domain-containing protein n=1 Tax=Thermococcus eurythermalis TaxID=1505907 RepID=A0A097QRQ0_9EURY|nr:hypothetical protein [Thermococcus eurythermalis]AIU69155.1 hypothetical protein TEU_01700 [Thermococcus eurythermalis]